MLIVDPTKQSELLDFLSTDPIRLNNSAQTFAELVETTTPSSSLVLIQFIVHFLFRNALYLLENDSYADDLALSTARVVFLHLAHLSKSSRRRFFLAMFLTATYQGQVMMEYISIFIEYFIPFEEFFNFDPVSFVPTTRHMPSLDKFSVVVQILCFPINKRCLLDT